MSAKPEPKYVQIECSVCGCDWHKHLTGPRKGNPNLEDCVRVLKQELAARPRYPQIINTTFPTTTTHGTGNTWGSNLS